MTEKDVFRKAVKLCEFVEECCYWLRIDMPVIDTADDLGYTARKTARAIAIVERNLILISKKYADFNSIDFYFAVAHECRHIYQYKHGTFDLDGASNKDLNHMSLSEYNMQPHELDANAFAVAIIDSYFHTMVLFESFDDKVRAETYMRSILIMNREWVETDAEDVPEQDERPEN